MTMRFQKADAKICVGVKFDDVGEHILKFAVQYCIRTGARLHVVHVCEPSLNEILDLHMDGMFPTAVYDYAKLANESRQKQALLTMTELLSRIPSTVKVTRSILEAKTSSAEHLHSEAEAHDCSLIMVGTVSDSHKFIPNGLSCALSLMSHAKLPIMVVKTNHKIEFTSKPFKVLIADDLRSESAGAIKSACELAFTLSDTDIYHLHINALTAESLASRFKKTVTHVQAKAEVVLESKDIEHLILKHLEEKLDARTKDMNFPLCISGCSYNKRVVSSDSVFDCLKQFVTNQKISLAVFGRHTSIHTNPFHIGKMPLYAMLELSCPIIIFPPSRHT